MPRPGGGAHGATSAAHSTGGCEPSRRKRIAPALPAPRRDGGHRDRQRDHSAIEPERLAQRLAHGPGLQITLATHVLKIEGAKADGRRRYYHYLRRILSGMVDRFGKRCGFF